MAGNDEGILSFKGLARTMQFEEFSAKIEQALGDFRHEYCKHESGTLISDKIKVSVDLSDNLMGNRSSRSSAVCDTLQIAPSALNSLDLSCNFMGPLHMIRLLGFVRKSTTLAKLSIAANDICGKLLSQSDVENGASVELFKGVAAFLPRQLVELDLSKNQVYLAGNALKDISCLSVLSTLNLSSNGISLAQLGCISSLSTLTSLDLSANAFNPDEIQKLISSLGAVPLQHLNLSGNRLGYHTNIKKLVDAMALCHTMPKTLRVLEFSNNSLTARGFVHFLEASARLTNLTDLNLSKNLIGMFFTKSSTCILKAWPKAQHLVKLNLSKNRLEDEHVAAVSHAWRGLSSLTSLNLANNNLVSVEGPLPLNIRHLNLTGNVGLTFPPPHVVLKGAKAVVASLKQVEEGDLAGFVKACIISSRKEAVSLALRYICSLNPGTSTTSSMDIASKTCQRSCFQEILFEEVISCNMPILKVLGITVDQMSSLSKYLHQAWAGTGILVFVVSGHEILYDKSDNVGWSLQRFSEFLSDKTYSLPCSLIVALDLSATDQSLYTQARHKLKRMLDANFQGTSMVENIHVVDFDPVSVVPPVQESSALLSSFESVFKNLVNLNSGSKHKILQDFQKTNAIFQREGQTVKQLSRRLASIAQKSEEGLQDSSFSLSQLSLSSRWVQASISAAYAGKLTTAPITSLHLAQADAMRALNFLIQMWLQMGMVSVSAGNFFCFQPMQKLDMILRLCAKSLGQFSNSTKHRHSESIGYEGMIGFPYMNGLTDNDTDHLLRTCVHANIILPVGIQRWCVPSALGLPLRQDSVSSLQTTLCAGHGCWEQCLRSLSDGSGGCGVHIRIPGSNASTQFLEHVALALRAGLASSCERFGRKFLCKPESSTECKNWNARCCSVFYRQWQVPVAIKVWTKASIGMQSSSHDVNIATTTSRYDGFMVEHRLNERSGWIFALEITGKDVEIVRELSSILLTFLKEMGGQLSSPRMFVHAPFASSLSSQLTCLQRCCSSFLCVMSLDEDSHELAAIVQARLSAEFATSALLVKDLSSLREWLKTCKGGSKRLIIVPLQDFQSCSEADTNLYSCIQQIADEITSPAEDSSRVQTSVVWNDSSHGCIANEKLELEAIVSKVRTVLQSHAVEEEKVWRQFGMSEGTVHAISNHDKTAGPSKAGTAGPIWSRASFPGHIHPRRSVSSTSQSDPVDVGQSSQPENCAESGGQMSQSKLSDSCGISLTPALQISSPVVSLRGHIYENSAIRQWIDRVPTSPQSRQLLLHSDLRPIPPLSLALQPRLPDRQLSGQKRTRDAQNE